MADSPSAKDVLESISPECLQPNAAQDACTVIDGEPGYLDHAAKQLEIHSHRQNIGERKHYAKKLFWLTAAWLIAVFAVVVATSVSITNPCWWPEWLPTIEFCKLSDAVLLALIGTTTANVLGLFVIVARYLFPDAKAK